MAGSNHNIDIVEEAKYYDLGTCTRPVTTKSRTAQIWFDRGLQWSYAFNQYDTTALSRSSSRHAYLIKL